MEKKCSKMNVRIYPMHSYALESLDIRILASNIPPQCATSPNTSTKCLTLVKGRAFIRESATISLVVLKVKKRG